MLLLAIIAFMGACAKQAAPAAPAKVYQFDIAHFWPAENFSAKYTQDWADMVTKNSNGQIKFRLYSSGSLLAATENWPGSIYPVTLS